MPRPDPERQGNRQVRDITQSKAPIPRAKLRCRSHPSPPANRYIGPVKGQEGTWVGVEWDDATRGKHDGSTGGVQYFSCVSGTTSGSFVRLEKVRYDGCMAPRSSKGPRIAAHGGTDTTQWHHRARRCARDWAWKSDLHEATTAALHTPSCTDDGV